MANPQQPELARSRKTPALDPDAAESVLSAAEAPTVDPAFGPVPADNRPGHHPQVEQDKPEAARFVAKVKEVAAGAEPEPEPRREVAPPPPSPRAEGLATMAGAPWKLAGDVLQRLRDRI